MKLVYKPPEKTPSKRIKKATSLEAVPPVAGTASANPVDRHPIDTVLVDESEPLLERKFEELSFFLCMTTWVDSMLWLKEI